MVDKAILLTIQKKYAERILNGEKGKEYRTSPPRIRKPTRTILYVSGVKQIFGECTMGPVYGNRASYGYPLPVYDPIRYLIPISWKSIREEIPGIRKPQMNFRYIYSTSAEDSRLLKILKNARMQVFTQRKKHFSNRNNHVQTHIS